MKRKALFLFAKQFKTDFVFFQESHSQAKDVHFWRAQWGNDIWCAHGTEFSAGVCCLKNNFTGDILHTECDTQGHFVFLIVKVNDSVCLITNIYGFNSTTENNKLLDKLEEKTLFGLSKFPNANVIIGGDFNVVVDSVIDRWPPGHPSKTLSKLSIFISKFDLTDIWRDNNPNSKQYTWSNKSGSRQSRIDFWLTPKSIVKEKVDIKILSTRITRLCL